MRMPSPPKQQHLLSTPYRVTSTHLSYLQAQCIPFIELFRLNKPIGILYLYFPCLIGTLAVATISDIPSAHLLRVNLLLFLSSTTLRSAGCSWNDTLDQELDRKVARTRTRPLARGAIRTPAAHVCTSAMLLLFFALQRQLPFSPQHSATPKLCVYYSVPFVAATGMYPLAKRFTYYPQAFLGIPSSWGLVIAFPALGLDLFVSHRHMALVCFLWVSNLAWTMLYDMIYGFQDVKDDLKVGIKSIALRHRKNPKSVLLVLEIVQVIFLGLAALMLNGRFASFFWIGCTTIALSVMVTRVNLASPASCAWWFKYGCLLVSGCTASGFCFEYARMRV